MDAFPTVDHTHNSVLLGQISKHVGDRMSGVLPNTQGRPDLEGMTQLVHSMQVKRNMERASIWGKVSCLKYGSDSTLIVYIFLSLY